MTFYPKTAFQEQTLLTQMLLSLRLAELAAQLATQAGEEVQRPLSREQLQRAFRVMLTEEEIVSDLVSETWQALEPPSED